MSNPTIGHESQFNGPFDILPNVLYTNPTAGAGQFTRPLSYPAGDQTFDIPGTGNPVKPNPTLASSQFLRPIEYPGDYQTFDYVYPLEPTTYANINTTAFVNTSIYRPSDVSYDDLIKQFASASDQAPWTPIISTTTPLTANATNIALSSYVSKGFGFAGSALGSLSGVPQVSQVTDSILGIVGNTRTGIYSTLGFDQLKPLPGVKYADFRSRRAYGVLNGDVNSLRAAGFIRLDGTSAATRGGRALYPIAAASIGGSYSVYNLDGMGLTGYGWGDHDNPSAIRNDFTLRSHITTKWVAGSWEKTRNLIERITPFRGDRVNVIDFGQRALQSAYEWNNSGLAEFLGAKANQTQDFIKFFFTGPKLFNGSTEKDDIIVFRALITSLSDTFSPTWTAQTMIGRADPNYHYTGVTRDMNLDFTVYATDRDEVKPIWRKLNALAGYTAPEYDAKTIALIAPWIRITIGDLYHQHPAIITSLTYTLHDTDSTWEINIEDDPEMMQVPHKITVSLGLTLISEHLPQKGGRFYSLAKSYDASGSIINGNKNWLSDVKPNPTNLELDNRYLPPLNVTSNSDSTTKSPGDVSVMGDNGPQVNIG